MSSLAARRRPGRSGRPGRVIAFPSPREPLDGAAQTGLWLVLCAWTMLVLPLVIAIYWLRVKGGEQALVFSRALHACHPPAAAALAALGAANYALWRGRQVLLSRGEASALTPRRWLQVSAASAAAFLGLKGWLLCRAVDAGLSPTRTHAASLWFGLATLQLAAALVGAAGLAWLLLRVARGAVSPARAGALRFWGAYHHVTGALSVVAFFVARAP